VVLISCLDVVGESIVDGGPFAVYRNKNNIFLKIVTKQLMIHAQ
jgi:hypothetical protein